MLNRKKGAQGHILDDFSLFIGHIGRHVIVADLSRPGSCHQRLWIVLNAAGKVPQIADIEAILQMDVLLEIQRVCRNRHVVLPKCDTTCHLAFPGPLDKRVDEWLVKKHIFLVDHHL